MEGQEETKLELFLQWLQANMVELRGCSIKYCGPNKGFGIFSSDDVVEGILLVVPLDLAITPMRVLQDPSLGPKCRAMFEEGEVDDRFLMILLLTVERLRKNSSWKPYLDMLPTTFGNPLWFTADELQELKGTTLYRATELQKKKLQLVYDDKVKNLVKELLLLDGDSESEVQFEDFLWANSIFWTRALNIPFSRAYVFPQMPEEQENCCSSETQVQEKAEKSCGVSGVQNKTGEDTSPSTQGETVWVEGLVPGIDFCNHDLKAAATWEVDVTGLVTGVPSSMYLLSADQIPYQIEKEIFISYGNKGNEELLYLYGFVINNNPDDFLMVHYPVEAFQNVPFTETKAQLLETQMAEMRCLLPRSLLDRGFFSTLPLQDEASDKCQSGWDCTYSWSGQRKKPSYLNKLVFPEEFLAALRTIAMQEEELLHVSALLEELGCGEERQPSAAEVQAAVWEACGDSGALQLLVDLFHMKDTESRDGGQLMSRNRWSSIVYRRGQKQLTRLFLREAENALQLCLSEQS
ncbi:uncharacterized protein LOC122665258 isoform X3 [Telopea speciosissima]|uniref:uncharacterized protein LOC122665258 isoform X3 n=1 Tax=Telopea speciosissima TaxID=54955 RepID=UPI001CC4D1D3|nr:uncharacterized protein LOC122665258 isoform X3 [Telopea speciosissima]